MRVSGATLGRVLRWPLKIIPAEAEVSILRGPLRGMKWIKGAGPNAYWVGTYEVTLLKALGDAIFPGAVVYDIGANVGIYTLLASLRAGPSGMAYAFEPLERNLSYLRRHVALNRLKNCMVFPEALGNQQGSRRFSADGWESSMARFSPDGEILIPATTLDHCIFGDAHLRNPDVLKIDVEGAELEVLQGADRAISEFHPKIFLEIHGTQLHADCTALLAARGYAIAEGYGQLRATWPSSAPE